MAGPKDLFRLVVHRDDQPDQVLAAARRIVEHIAQVELDIEIVLAGIDRQEYDLRSQIYSKQREIRALQTQIQGRADLAELVQGLKAWIRDSPTS